MRIGTLGWKDALEEGMATNSSILAWRNENIKLDYGNGCTTL